MQASICKEVVREHWEKEVCGSRYGPANVKDRRQFFDGIDRVRYEQEYMLRSFAEFESYRGMRVLEIGLGSGSDFVRWVQAGAVAFGRDLTEASVGLVRERLQLDGLTADVAIGDAECLREFPDNFFDLYYSWGVLHHTPNTEAALAEAYRVLKPGGSLKLMLYHYPSVGTLLVWLANGPLRGRFLGPRKCCARFVESPGTRVYSRREADALIRKYFPADSIEIHTYLGAGDLLLQKYSSRYRGKLWEILRRIYPRWVVKNVLGHKFGSEMTILARK